MAFTLNISTTVAEVAKRVELDAKQIPFATALAITRTVFEARKYAIDTMRRDMVAPVRFTLGGLRYQKATKQNLRGDVHVDPSRAGYLRHAAKLASTRTPRTFGYVMIPIGLPRVQGKGRVISPKLARTYRAQLLGDGNHFEGTIRGTRGIWERRDERGTKRAEGGRVRLKVLYLDYATYRQSWAFYERMRRFSLSVFPRNLDQSVGYALATARR